MIPLHLRISGFLSYRDLVELDFSLFDLACISGHNGACKSSLLDAITWALFGEARGKSNDVINLHPSVDGAHVIFTFRHEENTYRVQRGLPRGKSTTLEFRIRNGDEWRPLTEKTTRETQTRIEQTLRLDYETFVNASFFLQGKADQFTQQNAGKRKEVLSNILGLEVWEVYKNRAADRRKVLEREVDEIEGRVAEIDAELTEEEARRTRLAELESSLRQLTSMRNAQETILENLRKNAALLDEQRKLTATLTAGLERGRTALAGLETRLAAKQAERDSYADLLSRAKEIESAHAAWQKIRKQLDAWEKVAAQVHEQDQKRASLKEIIAAERARLEQELDGLKEKSSVVSDQLSAIDELREEIAAAKQSLAESEKKVKDRDELNARLQSGRERQAELKAENDALKADMNQLKERIGSLKSAQGVTCPLCGQELNEEHRRETLDQLESEGREKGDRFRANKVEMEKLREELDNYDSQVAKLADAENLRVQFASQTSQLTERL